MNDAPNLASPTETPTSHLEQVVATAFSTDNSQAMVRYKDAVGKDHVLVMAVEKLATLQHLMSQMRSRLKRRDLPVDQIVMQFPKQFMVGHSDQHRGVCAVTFDQQMPSEAVYVLTDEAALHLAEGLQQNVYSRMTPAERHAHARKKNPLLLPLGERIIRP